MNQENPMWVVILQAFAPLAVEGIESVIALIQKEAQGKAITPEDWRALAQLHAELTARQKLEAAVAKLPIPA